MCEASRNSIMAHDRSQTAGLLKCPFSVSMSTGCTYTWLTAPDVNLIYYYVIVRRTLQLLTTTITKKKTLISYIVTIGSLRLKLHSMVETLHRETYTRALILWTKCLECRHRFSRRQLGYVYMLHACEQGRWQRQLCSRLLMILDVLVCSLFI